MKNILYAGLLLSSGLPLSADSKKAVELEQITVYGEAAQSLSLKIDNSQRPISDSAEYLRREVAGFDGIRQGGHGIDPVYRGLKESNLTIQTGGAEVGSSCPGRMSPPTAYANAENYDNILFYRGGHTVQFGMANGGGTLVLEHDKPNYEDKNYHLKLSSSYRSQGDGFENNINFDAGNEWLYIKLDGHFSDASNYEDGNGDEVRSAFRNFGGNISLGFTPDEQTIIEMSYQREREQDTLFAGRGMDGTKSDADVYNVRFERVEISDLITFVKANAYFTDVFHAMDNFSLRTPGMMRMETLADAITLGGRASTGLQVTDNLHMTLGTDIKFYDSDAERNNGAGVVNAQMWPDARISNFGIFAEAEYSFTEQNRLISGLRLDFVKAEANDASEAVAGMGSMTANQLYQMYNGASASTQREQNLSGFIRFEHDLNKNTTTYLNVSSMTRTADSTERFMAAGSGNANNRWVGNPQLDPEKHQQVAIGIQQKSHERSFDISAFINYVDDFILRTRTHEVGNNATIYRNTTALLQGFEARYEQSLNDDWRLGGQLSYLRGRDRDNGHNLAQISPFSGNAYLEFTPLEQDWFLGAKLTWAATQNDTDTDALNASGLDVRETPGFAIVDLYGGWQINETLRVDAGIDNLFDDAYAYHLNSGNAFDVEQVQVNEPGRSYWLTLTAEF